MYLATKRIQTKLYTIAVCVSLDKKLNDSGALHSPFFAILSIKAQNGKLMALGDFFSLHIQSQKDPHKISFSEPLFFL